MMAREQRIDPALLALIQCPATGQPVEADDETLLNADRSRRYAVINGIPLLMLQAEATHTGYGKIIEENRRQAEQYNDFSEDDVRSFIDAMIVPTCGTSFMEYTSQMTTRSLISQRFRARPFCSTSGAIGAAGRSQRQRRDTRSWVSISI